MPVDTTHPEVALFWLQQAILSSEDITRVFGDRIAEFQRAPDKVTNLTLLFGIYDEAENVPLLLEGQGREYTSAVRSEAEIIAVKTYPSGGGDWADFTDAYYAIRKAVCGKANQPVYHRGVLIGKIYFSTFLRKLKRVAEDGDVQTLHYGLAIKITHR